jgi:hypothetical protein
MVNNKDNFSIDLFHNPPEIFSSNNLEKCRFLNLEYALSQIKINGFVLEFGVHSGSTINFISNILNKDTVYGFDSFEGLPEDWNISYKEKFNKHKKGYFAVETIPTVNENVKLVKGFFDQSLEPWIKENNLDQIKFLHIDSDLYSSAIYVLKILNRYIVSGTIIVFDEFYPWGRKRYETWEEHEYRALKEWITEFDREFKILSRNDHQQCTIKIVK